MSSRHLDTLQRKVEASARNDDRAAYFQHVSEAIRTFSAAAAQATVLRNLEQSPAAQLLLQEVEDACMRVDSSRNALYSSLLLALQQRLDEVEALCPAWSCLSVPCCTRATRMDIDRLTRYIDCWKSATLHAPGWQRRPGVAQHQQLHDSATDPGGPQENAGPRTPGMGLC